MNWREKAPPAAKLLVGEKIPHSPSPLFSISFRMVKTATPYDHFDFYHIQTSKSRDLDLDLKMKNRASRDPCMNHLHNYCAQSQLSDVYCMQWIPCMLSEMLQRPKCKKVKKAPLAAKFLVGEKCSPST